MENTIIPKGLTGKYRFKSNFFGSQVLWVQECFQYYEDRDGTFSPEFFRWRKATEEDMPEWYELVNRS